MFIQKIREQLFKASSQYESAKELNQSPAVTGYYLGKKKACEQLLEEYENTFDPPMGDSAALGTQAEGLRTWIH